MIGIGKTDVGLVRNNNEDSIFVSNDKIGVLPNLFIVSDGMGGHNAGEIASSHGIRFFCEFLERHKNAELNGADILDVLVDGTIYANKNVYEISLKNSEMLGMGATFSACVIQSSRLHVAHVGDSRVYIVHDAQIRQVSSDHTYVNEMVKAGQITETEAKTHPRRNIITRALGTDEGISVDGIVAELFAGDYVLLCSDGLNNMVTDESIKKIILGEGALFEKCARLIDVAKQNGGEDNISAILIHNNSVNEVTA